MRILFYLPVVTPWWFDNIVAPLIRVLSDETEVHVMVPPLWRGTGIGPDQLAGLAGCDTVVWHILDGEDHPRLRTSAADCRELLDLVAAIDADITLCRAAELDLPRRFPGTVRYIMEGGFPPFPAPNEWIVFRDHPLDHGAMPDLDDAQAAQLCASFEPAWRALEGRFGCADVAGRRARIGLPADRTVIGLPLDYEHEENFFLAHNPIRSNAALVGALAGALDGDLMLAVTDHPLNRLYCDRSDLDAVLPLISRRAQLIGADGGSGYPTVDMALASDGMVFANSKSITVAAFLGKPILRLSDQPTAPWLNAETDLDAFVGAVRGGTARAPAAADALRWFAFHAANNIVQPEHPDTDAAFILDMVAQPVSPARWQSGLRRYADVYPELFQ